MEKVEDHDDYILVSLLIVLILCFDKNVRFTYINLVGRISQSNKVKKFKIHSLWNIYD
jgi:hypothetical protein